MLVVGETPDERRANIRSFIETEQKLIAAMKLMRSKHPTLRKEIDDGIRQQQELIKQDMADLGKLERWRVENKLDYDEPFKFNRASYGE